MEKIIQLGLMLLLLTFSPSLFADIQIEKRYIGTRDSLSTHPIPDWYNDAKLGIMIHYGLYSVPGWAPLFNPMGKVGTSAFYVNNPYGAWYLNTMQIKGSPTYEYHLKTYGPNFTYDDFVPLFNEAAKNWNPDNWSALFEKSGAKYVVFVTKHHDGFLLWHSQFHNPYKPNFVSDRDIVNELTRSVRAHHMRMGLYYSGGYDWSWTETPTPPITDPITAIEKLPESEAYSTYVYNQWHELITKYHPDLIWNDIALPDKIDKFKLFADYYNAVPDGILDNRWSQNIAEFIVSTQPTDAEIDYQRRYDWFDYYTPEYLANYQYTEHRWEADHGPGYGFEYNRNEYEHPEHLKTLDEILADLSDVVSKNGNLLLAIGPEADGTITPYETNLLLGLGNWLHDNGESIYATRPWTIQTAIANTDNANIDVRFTQSKDHQSLYLILLKNPERETILIPNLRLVKNARVTVLHGNNPIPIKWTELNSNVEFNLASTRIPTEHPLVLKITPEPTIQK